MMIVNTLVQNVVKIIKSLGIVSCAPLELEQKPGLSFLYRGYSAWCHSQPSHWGPGVGPASYFLHLANQFL